MNLVNFIDIYAGGPGSGCNPAVGKCGRPRTGRKPKLGGTLSKQERLLLRQKGMLTRMKSDPLKPFPSTPITSRDILRTTTQTMKIPGRKGVITYQYTELRPMGKGVIGTKRWSSEPPNTIHPGYGRFLQAYSYADPTNSDRKVWAYELHTTDQGHGTTTFIEKTRTSPNSSNVWLQEVARDRYAEILSTKEMKFSSGRQAKDFLKFRYGIDMKWTK